MRGNFKPKRTNPEYELCRNLQLQQVAMCSYSHTGTSCSKLYRSCRRVFKLQIASSKHKIDQNSHPGQT
jgi:hypothetical protein